MPSVDPAQSKSDEHYLIDICDRLLQSTARRQHRFPFLLGDPGKGGKQAVLPIDAYYADLCLVVEVMERQHTEAVTLFDSRLTVSGVPRGQQRRLYDERRKEVLPQNGLHLISLETSDFPGRGRKLRREAAADEEIVRQKRADFLSTKGA